MNQISIPLVVTSAVVASAPYTALDNIKQRAAATLDALRKWRDCAPSLAIVLCDGSGYNFGAEAAVIRQLGNIEVLTFQNDVDGVRRLGKGYGEGEIIRYALTHSRQMATATHFYKCTAKLWVDNFQEVRQKLDSASVAFDFVFTDILKQIAFSPSAVDTRFYFCETNFYREFFIDAHNSVDDGAGRFLEHVFLERIQSRKGYLVDKSFPVRPIVLGLSGSSAKNYVAPRRPTISLYKYYLCRAAARCVALIKKTPTEVQIDAGLSDEKNQRCV